MTAPGQASWWTATTVRRLAMVEWPVTAAEQASKESGDECHVISAAYIRAPTANDRPLEQTPMRSG